VIRAVEVEYGDGRIAWAPIRFVAGYSNQLAQPHEQAYDQAQSQAAEAFAQQKVQGEARPCAWEAEAEVAIAAYEGRGGGRRGRPADPWRCYEVH
jgi:hypothetical protein